ncbi:TPA: hypothetical protein ACQZB2_004423 [Escherichia coli]|nr:MULTISPECIES: hypothetical protein [Escherichia]
MQVRWLGRDDASVVVMQQSHNGVTLTASDPASALAQCPAASLRVVLCCNRIQRRFPAGCFRN